MGKSNIKIASNIYVTPNRDNIQNKGFIQNISGYDALRKFKDQYSGSSLSNIVLTSVQEEEVGQPPNCSYAKNREHTHGKIREDGKLRYVGRCEYKQCEIYNTCDQVLRVERNENLKPIETDAPSLFDLNIDYTINFENVLKKSLDKSEYVSLPEDADEEIEEVSPIFKHQEKFTKISNIECIVESSIDSKILVNAGPGTGKTFCAINRLIYILKNNLASPEKILMLCYSKSAVNVIRDRIKESIKEGTLSYLANEIYVATFDSLAGGYTYHVLGKSPKSYNETIALYNKNINGECLNEEKLEYLIIDEIQDIVNERAKMVLNILSHIECGYLLLGDKCQAIYDFENNSNASVLSEEFYNELENSLHLDTMYYELTGNKRQTTELANISNEIRDILLNISEDEQFDWVIDTINQKCVQKLKLKELLDNANSIKENSAILCRNKGDVLMVSGELSKNKISHTVLTGDNNSVKLSRLIADILWDYTDTKISFSEFKERYINRIANDESQARDVYKTLTRLIEFDEFEILDLTLLKNVLIQNKQLPDNILTSHRDLVVSTIHRSKGREYNNVYILENIAEEYNKTSFEARVKYVAFTRPKNAAKIISKNYGWKFRKEKTSNRMFRLSVKNACVGIGISSDSHIDKFSFANMLEPKENLEIQQYIANEVSIYDSVLAKKTDTDEYEIFHGDNLIGKLSKESSAEFWSIIRSTRVKYAIPPVIENLYISEIYTIVSNNIISNLSSQHSHSGFWLGVEITGMGKVPWNYYG